MYEEIAISCFRLFGMRSLDEVDRMTPKEYRLLVEAWQYKEIDKEYLLHKVAFLNRTASAKKKVGKKMEFVFAKFSDFFDYKKEIEKKERKKKKESGRFEALKSYLRKKAEAQNERL